MSRNYIKESYFILPPPIRIAGASFAFFGAIATLINPFAITVFILGLFAVLFEQGMILDKENKRFKYYEGVWILRFGKWKWISEYPYLFMTKRSTGYNLYSITNIKFESRQINYIIGFSKGPRDQMFTFRKFGNMVQAENSAKNLANEFKLQILKSKNFQ